MHDDARPGHDLRQAPSGLILMNIALLHAHDMELVDAGAGHDRPIGFAENAALEQ